MASKQKSSTNLGISSTPEFSSKDYPDIYLDNLKLRNALGVLQTALDMYTGVIGIDPALWSTTGVGSLQFQNLSPVYAMSSAAFTAGTIVNFYDVAGVLTARAADASSAGKPAHAFVVEAVAAGAYGKFILQGVCRNIGGLITGATYFQSNTPGLIAAASGTILQRIGYSLGPSTLYFRPDLV